MQVIPEGEGPVKTQSLVVLVHFASFLVLVERVEVGVGVKARAEPDRVAAVRGALTVTPFGACCSRAGRLKKLVLLSRG
jgi:hypothetical protein